MGEVDMVFYSPIGLYQIPNLCPGGGSKNHRCVTDPSCTEVHSYLCRGISEGRSGDGESTITQMLESIFLLEQRFSSSSRKCSGDSKVAKPLLHNPWVFPCSCYESFSNNISSSAFCHKVLRPPYSKSVQRLPPQLLQTTGQPWWEAYLGWALQSQIKVTLRDGKVLHRPLQ